MRLEYLKLAQLSAGQTRVQAAHEPQEIRQSLPRVWMNHKQGLKRPDGGLIGELAYEGHDVAVTLEQVVESEGPDLEPYRLLQTSRAREGANREPAEDFVRLLDELFRPPDDGIEDSTFAAGGDGCGGSHCRPRQQLACHGPAGRAAQKRDALHVVRGVHCKALMHEWFRRLARRSSEIVGSAEMFLAACVAVIGWAVLGPRYGFSDTWQLVINTGTTIVTFLMVFIIQNAQNRDARAMQLKLDELIRAVKGARTGMVRLEEMTDQELCALAGDFEKLRSRLAVARQEPSVSSMTKRPAANVMPAGSESAA